MDVHALTIEAVRDGPVCTLILRGDIAAARGLEHVLPVVARLAASPVGFRETSRLIDEGYRLASDWLASHMMSASTEVVTAWLRPGSAR